MRWTALLACAAAWLAANLPASAQDGRWLRAESNHFVVFSDVSERSTREAIGDLEEFDALLRLIMNIRAGDAGPKLEIYLHNGRSSFERVYSGSARNVAGFYWASPEIVSAHAIYQDRVGFEARTILFHEYTHHLMHQHTTSGYPAWVVEGFAEFFSTVEFTDRGIEIGHYNIARASQLAFDEWLPLERMLTAQVFSLNQADRARFYAQSWALMHYCQTDADRQRAFAAYLRALRTPDADPIGAFTTAFGKSLPEIRSELREYLRRFPSYAIPRFEAARRAPTLSRLPASADRLLTLDVRVRTQGAVPPAAEGAVAPLLGDVRAAAEAYSGDEYATLVRARAEIMLGAPGQGRALLEPLLQTAPDHAQALYLMGLSHMREARDGRQAGYESLLAARPYFVRAFRIDPLHVPTLFHYAESHFAAPGPMSNDALNVLVEANNLAPQVEAIGLLTAMALIEVQRFDEAAAVLLPIATDPHGGPVTDRARLLLDAATRRDSQVLLRPPPPEPENKEN